MFSNDYCERLKISIFIVVIVVRFFVIEMLSGVAAAAETLANVNPCKPFADKVSVRINVSASLDAIHNQWLILRESS